MACSCLDKFDALLKERNTRIETKIVFGKDEDGRGSMTFVPHIGTTQIETGRGKPKAIGVSPTFCPFCGTAYALPLPITGCGEGQVA